MAKRISLRVRTHENLDDSNVLSVIKLLEKEPPITKKEACSILGIAYNTKRLGNIVTSYKDRMKTRKRLFAKNRAKPWEDFETKEAVISYLKGVTLSSISSSLYRSELIVKRQLVSRGIPIRDASTGYFNPELIPNACMSDTFKDGELVWSARYSCVAEIEKHYQVHKEHGNVYSIWLYGKHNQWAYQPAYELGALPILEKLNITADNFKELTWA